MQPNRKHPLIIIGKALAVLMACAAIWLAIYLALHRDQYSGTEPERLPSDRPRIADDHHVAEPVPPADLKFSDQ